VGIVALRFDPSGLRAPAAGATPVGDEGVEGVWEHAAIPSAAAIAKAMTILPFIYRGSPERARVIPSAT
jgi:hypothetical protein